MTVFAHLARDTDVPLVTRAAAQSDVSVLRVTRPAATTPIPAAGVPVIRGESGGHTHSLHSTDAFYDPATLAAPELLLGTLTVPEGSEAFLLHPEHGGLAIAPGTYAVGRQREYTGERRTSGEWRPVAD